MLVCRGGMDAGLRRHDPNHIWDNVMLAKASIHARASGYDRQVWARQKSQKKTSQA